ncbi:hypothetical protein MHYP_G00024550 [Metynnis hypsauchen]
MSYERGEARLPRIVRCAGWDDHGMVAAPAASLCVSVSLRRAAAAAAAFRLSERRGVHVSRREASGPNPSRRKKPGGEEEEEEMRRKRRKRRRR